VPRVRAGNLTDSTCKQRIERHVDLGTKTVPTPKAKPKAPNIRAEAAKFDSTIGVLRNLLEAVRATLCSPHLQFEGVDVAVVPAARDERRVVQRQTLEHAKPDRREAASLQARHPFHGSITHPDPIDAHLLNHLEVAATTNRSAI